MESPSSSPLLVIGSGSSVVTWDCRDDSATSSNSGEAVGRRVYHPFASQESTIRIADLAWNHNGQGECACFASLALVVVVHIPHTLQLF